MPSLSDLPLSFRALEALENAYVAAVKACPVGPFIPQVESVPMDLSPMELGNRLKKLPCVLIMFGGGEGDGQRVAAINGQWTLFVATGQGAQEWQRRYGTPIVLGAYQLALAIATSLHATPLPCPTVQVDGVATPIPCLSIGAPYVASIRPMASEGADTVGISIYSVQFNQRVTFPPPPTAEEMEGLSDFAIFDSETALDGVPEGGGSLPLPDDEVTSEDVILLPTE